MAEKYVRPGEVRAPVAERAGTKIDHRFAVALTAADGKFHGLLDRRQRIYQAGGEARNFIRLVDQAITLDWLVWEAIKSRADYIEMVDHDLNQCYRCSMKHAVAFGWHYRDPRLRARYAIPLKVFDVVDAQWFVVTKREVP